MAPICSEETNLVDHWTALRSNLHDASSWSESPAASLTYVPTLAGFTGPAQRDHFCTVHGPASRHPFHPHTSARFNNRLNRISIAVDRQKGIVTEELALSMLHNERLDWLLPGQDETRRVLNVQFVIVGTLELDQPHLLHTVRVYWEQAGVWKESGLLSRVLAATARVGPKAFDEQSALEQFTIPDGAKVNVRILNPTPYNCNQLTPLDYGTVPPLNTMTALLTDLPAPPRYSHPALNGHNILFGGETVQDPPTAGNQNAKKDNPVFKTTMEFKDDFEAMPCNPNQKRSIDLFTGPVEPSLPSVSLDPKRNQSTVFVQTEADHTNDVHGNRSMDPNRHCSSIFSPNSPKIAPENQTFDYSASQSRFESHIFDTNKDPHAPAHTPKQLVCHIVNGESTQKEITQTQDVDPNRFSSQINFPQMNSSANARPTAPSSNRNILLGDSEETASTKGRAHRANTSSIFFDFDNPEAIVQQPSTRYFLSVNQ